jgi:predicted kinase
MKSLNFARPQLLMIVGLPGAGKSFFARQFSEMFGTPTVSPDRIRYELFANPTYSTEENNLVNRMAMYLIDELLKTKRSFMVDGVCNSRADRQRLTQLAKKADYGSHVVWVQTDLATCRSRALKRNPEKRIEDKYNPTLSEAIFEGLTRRFTEPTREAHVVISGKHTYNTQAKMVLRKLVAAREVATDAAHQQAVQATQRPNSNRPAVRGVVIHQE